MKIIKMKHLNLSNINTLNHITLMYFRKLKINKLTNCNPTFNNSLLEKPLNQ